MKKLFVPQPEITLYDTGFNGLDLLDRQESGRQLSNLIERIEEPLVIAVDGEWGSGKSFFLKCWVGAHRKENGGTAETVYFDAFRHDFLDDPLLSLTQALVERLEKKPSDNVGSVQKAVDKLKKYGALLARPAARVALVAATAGASEVTGAIGNATLGALGKEAAKGIDALWQAEAGKHAAMKQFRSALTELTKHPDDPSEEQRRKIVIAVDELDRCRPDYALTVLETIKHFFDVPHVHFILGINLNEMENSVRARYGPETNAHKYLQKFISLKLPLPEDVADTADGTSVMLKYFEAKAKDMELTDDFIKVVQFHLELPGATAAFSLRMVEKLLNEIAITQSAGSFATKVPFIQHLMANILILKIGFPEAYAKARSGAITSLEFRNIFGVDDDFGNHGRPESIIAATWHTAVGENKSDQLSEESVYYFTNDIDGLINNPRKKMMQLIRQTERLKLTD